MFTKNEILRILEKDVIRNVNLINFIKDYTIVDIKVVGESVLVKGISDENWVYISSKSEEEFRALVDELNQEDEYFAIMEDWMIPILMERYKIDWSMSCVKLYFPADVPLPENQYKVEELKPQEAEYIFQHYDYKQYSSVEYTADRIRTGDALGIYDDNQLVAWIITHDDGAMGFLTVLPEYRRKGYGYELTIAMIKRLRKAGEVAFVHIEEDNVNSLNLALKLGFKRDRVIHWMKLGLDMVGDKG